MSKLVAKAVALGQKNYQAPSKLRKEDKTINIAYEVEKRGKNCEAPKFCFSFGLNLV